jgi:signal transduction histidine kinase/ActR/RegA family two-component response regulator
MKVRAYLVLTAAAILIPVVIFSTVALGMLLNAERAAALRGMHETARATALIIDRELASAEAALKVLTSSRRLAQGDLAGFHTQAGTADRGPGAWTVLFDASGKQLVNTRVPFGTPLPPARPDGAERARKFFAENKTAVSNLLEGPLAGTLVTTVNVAVPGNRYVLSEVYATEFFRNAIEQRQIPADWIVGIVDRQGRFIARSHKSAELVGKQARPELVRAAAQNREGQLRHDTVEGIEAYDVFTHSALSGWTVAVAAPVELIESSARRAVIVAAIGLLAALACAAGAAVVFGRRLVLSLSGAKMSAAALGRGEAPRPAASGVVEVDQLHAALAEAGALLAQADVERTRLLASEQEARQVAEQQNKAKDTFLAMLGHELRNPLSAISGAIAVMEAAGPTADMSARARAIIARQSQHLERIIDDLLDAARMLTGKISLVKRPLDLGEAVRTCVAGLQATGQTEGYTVQLDVQPAWLEADPTRIDQIVNNLVFNALKYTPAGGHIAIRVRAQGEHAVLEVRDNGVGIAPELLPNVFVAFVQGASSIDRAKGGLGIGLTMVRRLAELHGGSATAASDGPGRGSTFTVRLPLAREAVAAALPPAATASGQGSCILLVEDNHDARIMIATVLSLHEYRVLEASNGTDGLRLAREEAPDVAVVDIGLPDMNGYDCARRLRAESGTCGIGLIALTGYGLEADTRNALEAGFDIHLVKPVNTGRLLDAIEQLVAKRQQQAPAPP